MKQTFSHQIIFLTFFCLFLTLPKLYIIPDLESKWLKLLCYQSLAYLALSQGGCEIFEKGHGNKMMKFLLIVYFHGTMNYKNIFFLNSVLSKALQSLCMAKSKNKCDAFMYTFSRNLCFNSSLQNRFQESFLVQVINTKKIHYICLTLLIPGGNKRSF